MKKIILICFALVLMHLAHAQTFVNNGAIVSVTAGGQMIVVTDGSSPGSGSLENKAATSAGSILTNAGLVTIQGSFVNDASAVADGAGTSTGRYYVLGDWNNSGSFNANNSTVNLYSSLPQQITSDNNTVTTFYNLIDSNPGVKTQTVSAFVGGVLTIYSVEHATVDNSLTVTNTDPNAIIVADVTNSFVSSTHEGRLVRNTDQKAEYIFPTGINAGNSAKIRELSVTPPTSKARTYQVRYADDNAGNTTTVDGYDTASKAGSIKTVNDAYYHLVTSSDVDPTDLAIYFDPAVDQTWAGVGRWTTSQWQNLQNCVVVSSTNGSNHLKAVKPSWVPTPDSVYALIDTIALNVDFNFPNVFVADGVGIPSDNTVFQIINVGGIVTLQELSVFNRWGEMVFDSKRDGAQAWNGHFNGKLQPQGNYVYRAVVTNNSTGKQYPLVTGNVSLLW